MKGTLFDVGSKLRNISVKVNEIDLFSEDITDFEIHWDGTSFQVEGNILLKDNRDYLNLFKSSNKPIFNIYLTDLEDKSYVRDFYVISMEEAKGDSDNEKTLLIKFIDVISFTLKNTYISKGYVEKTLTEIIEDLFKVASIDSLYKKENLTKNFTKTEKKYSALVVPSDRSIYDFIEFQLAQEGYIWFQDKQSMNIVFIESVFPKNLKDFKDKDFIEDVENPQYGYKIVDMNISHMNAYDNLKLPTNTSFIYDPSKKSMLKMEANIANLYDMLKIADIDEKYIQGTNGVRSSTLEVTSSKEFLARKLYFTYMQNNKLIIFTYGKVEGNKLFEKRKVYLKGNTTNKTSTIDGDLNLSGDYVVLGIHDKIMNDKMVQKIILGRLNNSAKETVKKA